ncbi:hypothetical protein RRG08_016453 [Elysia crispata]|uniref:Uncharacterized protein n=1 Tax=Elysia crispata TaxID=231223 RepID=A0AAE0YAF7_9GAST|nr:hypothetical protein RRG08_016453 [Elysia crispata]
MQSKASTSRDCDQFISGWNLYRRPRLSQPHGLDILRGYALYLGTKRQHSSSPNRETQEFWSRREITVETDQRTGVNYVRAPLLDFWKSFKVLQIPSKVTALLRGVRYFQIWASVIFKETIVRVPRERCDLTTKPVQECDYRTLTEEAS